MNRYIVQVAVGFSVIVVHLFAFVALMVFNTEYTSMSQRMNMALVLLPVTATYFTAVVKSAVDNQTATDTSRRVNLNYVMVVFLVTGGFLSAVIFVVLQTPGPIIGTPEDAKQWLVGLEIGLGGSFGYIAGDLFGKIEKVVVRDSVNQAQRVEE